MAECDSGVYRMYSRLTGEVKGEIEDMSLQVAELEPNFEASGELVLQLHRLDLKLQRFRTAASLNPL